MMTEQELKDAKAELEKLESIDKADIFAAEHFTETSFNPYESQIGH